MGDLKKLPLFPLSTVLFPGMVLPLNIFEPRYRVMIGRCIQQNEPFGVVLIREGTETDEAAVAYEVGTAARITQADRLPDGRYRIQAVGYERFKIREYFQEKPFKIGLVEDYPVTGMDSDEAAELVTQIRPRLKSYLSELASLTDATVSFEELPEEALALAYFIAILVPLPVEDKQDILTVRDVQGMLRLEQSLLKREFMLLKHMIGKGTSSSLHSETTFSMN